jgi:hypothetical protein
VFLLDDTIEVDLRGNDPLAALQWTGQDAAPGRHNDTPAAVEHVTDGREAAQVGMAGELLGREVLTR